MHGFEDVKLTWDGEDFTVPADRQLMMIAQIEDALAGDDGVQAIGVLLRKEGVPYSRLACAYGAALRYAGCDISNDDVYLSMMEGLSQNKSEMVAQIQSATMAMLSIVSPPMGRILRGGIEKKTPVSQNTD